VRLKDRDQHGFLPREQRYANKVSVQGGSLAYCDRHTDEEKVILRESSEQGFTEDGGGRGDNLHLQKLSSSGINSGKTKSGPGLEGRGRSTVKTGPQTRVKLAEKDWVSWKVAGERGGVCPSREGIGMGIQKKQFQEKGVGSFPKAETAWVKGC